MTAVVNAVDVTSAGVASESISVTYTGSPSSPINDLTIDRTDLAVTNRQGATLPVSGVSIVDNADGTVTATYSVPAPQGTFTSADNNVYSITVLPHSVSDTANNTVGSASGAFIVNIPGPNQSPTGVTALSPLNFVTEYTVTQTDTQTIAGGRQFVSSSDVSASQAVVERLNTDGTPDTTFGVNGIFVFPQSAPGETDAFYAMALQDDGKIVAVGTRNNDLLVVRLNTDGTLDPTFGSGGVFPQNSAGAAGLFGVAITPDGKIVAGGSDSAGNFIIIRLKSDGTPDASFNAGATADSINPVTGAAIPLNPAFTTGGEFIYNPGFEGNVVDRILIEPGTDSTHYKIVAVGSSAGVLALARINADGTPDVTFGGDQIALTQGLTTKPGLELIYQLAPEHLNRTQVDQPIGVTLQDDGTIIVAAGSAHNTTVTPAGHGSSDFGVARLTASGHLDPTFNRAGTLPGVVITDFSGGDDYANSLSVDPATGQIIVVGTSYNASLSATTLGLQTAIAVYTSGGILDPSFNGTGTQTFASDISLTRAAVDTRLPAQAVSTRVNPSRGTIDVATTNSTPGTISTLVRRVQVVAPFSLNAALTPVQAQLAPVPSIQFVITYTSAGATQVNVSTLSNNDLLVEGPSGQLAATLVASNQVSPTSVQATYRVTGPVDTGLVAGVYTVSATGAANAVRDTSGDVPTVGGVGTFQLQAPGVLTATLNAVPAQLPGVASTQFTVTYTAPGAALINASSLSGNDVVVQGPDGTQLPATLVSAGLVDAQSLQATYQVDGPASAGLAGGTYTVSTTGSVSGVHDALNETPATAAIGTFRVAPNDLTPSAPAGKIPAAVVTGSAFKGPVKIVVSNTNADHTPLNEFVTVNLLASPTAGSTQGAATLTSITRKVKLKAGKSKTFTLHNFTWPAGAGSYFLTSTVMAGGLEQAAVVSSAAVVVAQAFIDVQNLAVTPATVKLISGKNATAFVMLQNNGNVVANATASATVSYFDGASLVPIPAVPIKLKLKPGQQKRYRLKFTSPVTGTFPLSITVATPGDTNTSNDAANSGVLG